MKNWKIPYPDKELNQIVRQAFYREPQRVTLNDDIQVIVVSAAEYARLTGETPAQEAAASETDERRTEASLFEFMQNSPWAEAVRDGDWPWEWDDETRSWVTRAA